MNLWILKTVQIHAKGGLHLKKNESMEFVQRGQPPNPNFFGIQFGSIEIKVWGQSRAIDTYFSDPNFRGEGEVNKKCFFK